MWQAGSLNGVGGKIELGETPKNAMIREFTEETGLKITNWTKVLVLRGTGYKLHVFKARSCHITPKVETTTDEVVGIYSLKALDQESVIPNLRWLLPLMAYEQELHFPFTLAAK